MEHIGTVTHCWWECRTAQPLWKAGLFSKVNLLLQHDPAIVILGIYPSLTKKKKKI